MSNKHQKDDFLNVNSTVDYRHLCHKYLFDFGLGASVHHPVSRNACRNFRLLAHRTSTPSYLRGSRIWLSVLGFLVLTASFVSLPEHSLAYEPAYGRLDETQSFVTHTAWSGVSSIGVLFHATSSVRLDTFKLRIEAYTETALPLSADLAVYEVDATSSLSSLDDSRLVSVGAAVEVPTSTSTAGLVAGTFDTVSFGHVPVYVEADKWYIYVVTLKEPLAGTFDLVTTYIPNSLYMPYTSGLSCGSSCQGGYKFYVSSTTPPTVYSSNNDAAALFEVGNASSSVIAVDEFARNYWEHQAYLADNECSNLGITDVFKGAKCALIWAFYPSQQVITYANDVKNDALHLWPIGYGTLVYEAFTATGTATTSPAIAFAISDIPTSGTIGQVPTASITLWDMQDFADAAALSWLAPAIDFIDILLWFGFAIWLMYFATTRHLSSPDQNV